MGVEASNLRLSFERVEGRELCTESIVEDFPAGVVKGYVFLDGMTDREFLHNDISELIALKVSVRQEVVNLDLEGSGGGWLSGKVVVAGVVVSFGGVKV